MDSNQKFHKSFLGFRSGDVLQYIESLHGDMAKQQRDYEQQLTELKQQAMAGSGEVRALRLKLQDAENRLTATARAVAEQGQTEVITADQRAQIARLESEVSLMTARARAAEQRVAELEGQLAEAMRDRQEYDDFSVQVGKVFLEAQSSADVIVANAQIEANRLESAAGEAVSQYITGITEAQTDLSDVRETVREMLDGFSARLDHLDQTVAQAKIHLTENIKRLTEEASEQPAPLFDELPPEPSPFSSFTAAPPAADVTEQAGDTPYLGWSAGADV